MSSNQPNWVVIHIAHSEGAAERIERALFGDGFVCRLNPLSRIADPSACVEIQVLSCEAREALDLIREMGFST